MTKEAKVQPGSRVQLDHVTVVFRAREEFVAIKDLVLEASPGEFLCILGTTGCGKSTILNVVAGFVRPTVGRVLADGQEVTGPNSERGMVFQQHALFPWTTVLGNIEFGPISRGFGKKKSRAIADKLIDLVGLGDFSSAYPGELSGGMQQRVGLARALANDPALLLMDEPFGSLDAQTRTAMQELLLGIWAGTGKTVMFVTHDIDEAIFLADRIVILTARPGHMKAEISVPLPRPREYDIVTSQAYIEIKRQLLDSIREETVKAMSDNIRAATTRPLSNDTPAFNRKL